MKFLLFIFIFFSACNSTKSVYICGDHECVNKKEAKQYFDENLTLEIKVIEKNKNDKIYDLVKLNMSNLDAKDEVEVLETNKQTRKLVKLSEKQIKEKKEDVIFKENKKKKLKKKFFNKKKSKKSKIEIVKKTVDINQTTENKLDFKTVNSTNNICLILEKCDIDEISNYLNKVGKNKNYPKINIK
jgi:predicted RNA-binding protein YlxR (DUF448 family)|tara:strand:+ start:93 stop:650 length:558 start_codon:yes stop_codon:yes gene_type:complete